MAIYQIFNGPMPTVAGIVPITTGTAIKTMLQIKPGATIGCKIIEWGISFDGAAAATPGRCELIQTDVAATVTACVAADLHKVDAAALMGGDPTTALISVGTAATGYTASVEGSTTASRLFDSQLIAPTNQYIKQFPLGREPFVEVAKFLRIRVTFTAAILCTCYVTIEV